MRALLLSDLLYQFPELTLRHADPAQLAVYRIDALHGASTPVDGTLYLHADAAEAARIVNGWQGQYRLGGLAILTARSDLPPVGEPGEVVWVEYAVSGPLPIDLSARLLRALFESQPRSVGEDEQLQDDLVEELLTRPVPYATETLRRAHQAALDLSRFDVVVLIGGRSYDPGRVAAGGLPTKQALIRETRRAAADFAPGIGVFRVGTHIVALLDSRRHPPATFAARLAAYLQSAFPASYVLAAVGRAVGRAAELGNSYREARAALEVTLDTVRQERWVHYDDVRHLLFYREIRRSPELIALIEGSLRPLLDLPGDYRKVLLETLVAYLEHNRSPHRAAVALGVHPNTLKYRMKRIAEFIDLNTLSGGNYVLYFLAAKLNT